MSTQKFSTLYVARMGIDNLYALIKTTTEIALLVKDNLGSLPKIALTRLQTVNNDLEKRMKKNLKSILTPELTVLNTHRNKLFSEIKRFVDTAAKSSLPVAHEAGTALRDFLTPYWKTQNEPLNTITSIYEGILDRYHATPLLQTQAASIGIVSLIEELENVNVRYDALYKQRNNEISSKTGDSASEIKNEAINSYEQFCNLVEQATNLTPNHTFTNLFNEMDGLRKKYASITSKKSNTGDKNTKKEA